MQVITLQLPLEAVQSLLHVLGNLPTSSGAYPLMVEIQRQGQVQLQQKQVDAQTEQAAPEQTEAANENA